MVRVNSKSLPFAGRRPGCGNDPVRHVDERQAHRRLAAALVVAAMAGTMESSSGRASVGAQAAQERAAI